MLDMPNLQEVGGVSHIGGGTLLGPLWIPTLWGSLLGVPYVRKTP